MRFPRPRLAPVHLIVLAMAALCLAPAVCGAGDDVEAQAKRARGGGGLRAGTWDVQNLEIPASGTASETGSYEGWFQKGLDVHLVIETTMGFWQRTRSVTQPGSLGTSSTTKTTSYFVPTLTSLKIYPVTKPPMPLEPYISAGAGPVLEVDREHVTSTDPLVVAGDGASFHTGLGLQAGGGIDWNPPGPFGVTLGARYQWATFSEDAGGQKLYKGPGLNAGVTYHFRYQ